MFELDAVNMQRRVEVTFYELRIGDMVQHWCKRGVSAAKVVYLTFKGCGKVESFRVDGDPSNYYKLAFLRAWTYTPITEPLKARGFTVDATLFDGIGMGEVKVDNESFEKQKKDLQILAMMDACQVAGIELTSTGMNIYDVMNALYEAGFKK